MNEIGEGRDKITKYFFNLEGKDALINTHVKFKNKEVKKKKKKNGNWSLKGKELKHKS